MKFEGCDWCPDNICREYWEVWVFKDKHRICGCCYKQLQKVDPE